MSALRAFTARNREIVLTRLAQGGPARREELMELTGLSRSALHRLLAGLRDEGLVHDVRDPEAARRAGRPSTLTAMTATSSRRVVAVVIRHAMTDLAIVSEAGEMLSHRRIPIGVSGPFAKGIERVEAELAQLMVAAAPLGASETVLGLPAMIDGARGGFLPVADPHVGPGWYEISLADRLAAVGATATIVENDTNLGALGEAMFGAARGASSFLYVRVSVASSSSAYMVGGHLIRGESGFAGQFGHVSIQPDGIICACGKRGCLHAINSQLIREFTDESGLERFGAVERILERACTGDPSSVRLLEDIGAGVGHALSSAVNLLAPAAIVLGGDLVDDNDIVYDAVAHVLARNVHPAIHRNLTLLHAQHGRLSALLGAAVAARHGSPWPSAPA